MEGSVVVTSNPEPVPVIWVPYPPPGMQLTLAAQFSCHDRWMVCPWVGIARNCHDLGWSGEAVPVAIYLSTVTSPLMVWPVISPIQAVCVLDDFNVRNPPVFKLVPEAPYVNEL